MFEDMDDDGVLDFDQIDDARNGYLQISGSWPTCGCSCSSTVGAYKNSKGDYTFLQSDQVICDWERKISSNRPIEDLLPEGFGIHSFTSEPVEDQLNGSAFFLDFEIPRKGTDTKVKLELIPFGLFVKGDQLIGFGYKQQQPYKRFHGIRKIAANLENVATMDHLLNGRFDKISLADQQLIQNQINKEGIGFNTQSELRESLIMLENIYEIYKQLETTELTLGWNRTESRFFIKGKGEELEKQSFIDFLLTSPYWDVMC
ncbi:MAG: hypothetical protein Sapg2KO_41330 [Saprospiraceae bacterium]